MDCGAAQRNIAREYRFAKHQAFFGYPYPACAVEMAFRIDKAAF